MDLGLAGKKVIITGASRGIGRGIAVALAREGAKVGVVARHRTGLKELLDEIGGNKPHVYAVADLSQEGMPEKVFEDLRHKLGGVDVVVNNLGDTLGITDPYCPIKDWRRVFRINFEIAVEMDQCALRIMLRQGSGRIVHVASNASLENSGPVTYCVTKAALAEYSASLGIRVAPKGVIVSAILPGAIISKGSYWERTMQSRPEHAKRYILERLPLRRFGSPQEIGNMTVMLCSRHAALFAGNGYGFDGGQSKHFFGLN